MPVVDIEIEVWCECGEGLCGNSRAATRGQGIVVEPCPRCLDNAHSKGYDEGYDNGYDDGYSAALKEIGEGAKN